MEHIEEINDRDLPEYLIDNVYDGKEASWQNAKLIVRVETYTGTRFAELRTIFGSFRRVEHINMFIAPDTLKKLLDRAFERAMAAEAEYDADAHIRAAEDKADDAFLESRRSL